MTRPIVFAITQATGLFVVCVCWNNSRKSQIWRLIWLFSRRVFLYVATELNMSRREVDVIAGVIHFEQGKIIFG